jgi:hypothetical protein
VTKASRGGRYARFLGLSSAIVVALLVIGIVPTRRLGGEAALTAMIGGCVIGLISAAMAGGLLVAVDGASPEARMQRAFLAMVVRLAVVVVLGAAAVLSGTLERQPMLIWVAIAYLALLPLEVMLAIET